MGVVGVLSGNRRGWTEVTELGTAAEEDGMATSCGREEGGGACCVALGAGRGRCSWGFQPTSATFSWSTGGGERAEVLGAWRQSRVWPEELGYRGAVRRVLVDGRRGHRERGGDGHGAWWLLWLSGDVGGDQVAASLRAETVEGVERRRRGLSRRSWQRSSATTALTWLEAATRVDGGERWFLDELVVGGRILEVRHRVAG